MVAIVINDALHQYDCDIFLSKFYRINCVLGTFLVLVNEILVFIEIISMILQNTSTFIINIFKLCRIEAVDKFYDVFCVEAQELVSVVELSYVIRFLPVLGNFILGPPLKHFLGVLTPPMYFVDFFIPKPPPNSILGFCVITFKEEWATHID